MILRLNLKTKWWNQIKSGEKSDELRLATDYWRKRLIGRTYQEVLLLRGYPKRGDTESVIRRKLGGITEQTIIHEEFGSNPVTVFVIDVQDKLEEVAEPKTGEPS